MLAVVVSDTNTLSFPLQLAGAFIIFFMTPIRCLPPPMHLLFVLMPWPMRSLLSLMLAGAFVVTIPDTDNLYAAFGTPLARLLLFWLIAWPDCSLSQSYLAGALIVVVAASTTPSAAVDASVGVPDSRDGVFVVSVGAGRCFCCRCCTCCCFCFQGQCVCSYRWIWPLLSLSLLLPPIRCLLPLLRLPLLLFLLF